MRAGGTPGARARLCVLAVGVLLLAAACTSAAVPSVEVPSSSTVPMPLVLDAEIQRSRSGRPAG